jgi:glyoxylase I family protein
VLAAGPLRTARESGIQVAVNDGANVKVELILGEGDMFGIWGVRYQVKVVDRSIAFYTNHLGFKLEHQAGSMFASVSLDGLKVFLSGPGSSGSRPLPDGKQQAAGGWNRIVLRVDDLTALVPKMKEAGVRFRNEIEVGPAGKQIQLEDPDGNPIELFEPAN